MTAVGKTQGRLPVNEGPVGRVLTRQGDRGRDCRAEARPTDLQPSDKRFANMRTIGAGPGAASENNHA